MRGAYGNSMPQRLLDRLLHYKPGAALYIISVLAIFLAMIFITRYRMTGHVNLRAMWPREQRANFFGISTRTWNRLTLTHTPA